MEAHRTHPGRRALGFLVLAAALVTAGAPLPATADGGGGGDATPDPEWEDEAAARGLVFARAGTDGTGYFYPVTGGGACIADFDGDGFDDVYLVDQLHEDASLNEEKRPMSRIFRNLGDGDFSDVTDGSGVGAVGWGMGCGAGDYDGDGDLDLYVTMFGESSLFRNDGPFRFTNVTDAAGVSTLGKCGALPCWSHGATFGDADADGCVDLYVANYVDYDASLAGPGENGPEYYEGQPNLFFHNDCDGTFTDRSVESGLQGTHDIDSGKSFQGVWLDFDADGDDDLYVTNDEVPNFLFRNDGALRFTEVAPQAGVDDEKAGMGVDAQDVDGDGRPDLYFTHYQFEQNGFYTNDGDGTFTDRSGTSGLGSDDCCVGWGTGFLDFDADGDVDIFAVNGHTRDIPDIYAQERLLYRHDGGLTFTDVAQTSGDGMSADSVARGMAMGDLDLNGVLDFVVVNIDGAATNLLMGAGPVGHWLQVDLRQGGPNGRALGAVVTVTPDGGDAVTRIHRASQSYVSQHSEREYFGLGNATSATVTIRWPDGATESWTVDADRALRLVRGDPQPREDVFSPATSIGFEPALVNGWLGADAHVRLESVDRGATLVSGVDRTEYRIDAGAWTTYTAPFHPPEGEHTLQYRAVDVAGNVEPAHTLVVRTDDGAPASTMEVAPLVNGHATAASRIALRATDGVSGVDRIEYCWTTAASSCAEWTLYEGPVAPQGEGAFTFIRRAVDRAGNEEPPTAEDVLVDAVAPSTWWSATGPVLEEGGVIAVTSATAVALHAVDHGSGLALLEYRVDDAPWREYDGPLSLTGDDGLRRVSVRAVDAVANERVESWTFDLDNARPPPIVVAEPAAGAVHAGARASIESPDGNVTVLAGRVPVRLEAGADVSGVAFTRVLVDGVVRAESAGPVLSWTWDSLQEVPGRHDVEFQTEDGLGNVGRLAIRIVSVPALVP